MKQRRKMGGEFLSPSDEKPDDEKNLDAEEPDPISLCAQLFVLHHGCILAEFEV